MTDSADKELNELARLKKALIDDILDASDESIIAEARQDGHDPAALAVATRALFEKAALASNKAALAAARAAVAADRGRTANVMRLDPAAARQRLARLVAQQPEAAMTMAARKSKPSDLSDEEVFGLLEDFEELGISPREEPDSKP